MRFHFIKLNTHTHSSQPTRQEITKNNSKGDLHLRELYKIFGDFVNSNTTANMTTPKNNNETTTIENGNEVDHGDVNKHTNHQDRKIEQYRKTLEQVIFKNGGQLRDYQAEGVSWMLANYVNGRSSILADESKFD